MPHACYLPTPVGVTAADGLTRLNYATAGFRITDPPNQDKKFRDEQVFRIGLSWYRPYPVQWNGIQLLHEVIDVIQYLLPSFQ
jgi:hypothetical protein